MGRSKQPVDLLIAKGKKHLTKAEIQERRNSEIKVDFKDVKPPEYLPQSLVEEFNDIANKLITIGILTELDADCLARYLLSKQTYLQYTKLLTVALKKNDLNAMDKLMSLQDKAFKQTRASAGDLGLTISSRCKLVMPTVVEQVKTNKFDRFRN